MESIINFRVPIEIRERVETLAKRSLISISDVARIAVLEKLERDEPPAPKPETAEAQP